MARPRFGEERPLRLLPVVATARASAFSATQQSLHRKGAAAVNLIRQPRGEAKSTRSGVSPLGRSSIPSIDPISDAAHRDDLERGAAGELLAQPAHVDVDGLGVADIVVAPDLLQQVATRVHPSRVGEEEGEKVELARRQLDLYVVEPDPAGGAIEHQP